MSRFAAPPDLDQRNDLFLDQAEDYFKACLAEWGPAWATDRTTVLIEEALAHRATGKIRAQVRFDRIQRGAWEAVVERHRPDARQVAERMANGCWEDARALLAHCLRYAAPEARAA